jgi:hypothetical protein
MNRQFYINLIAVLLGALSIMRTNDAQVGSPQILYKGTTAQVESLSGMVEGAIAYATDTDKIGTYNGAAWVWGLTSAELTSELTVSGAGDLYLGEHTTGPYYEDNHIWGIAQFHVRQEGDFAKARLTSVGGYRSWLAFDIANGTFESPTGIVANNIFVSMVGVGLPSGGATMEHGPQIDMVATENWDGSHRGNRIDFITIPNGSTTQGTTLTLQGDVTTAKRLQVTSPAVPASAGATGTAGEIAWDTNYLYVCVATNTWKRVELTGW